MSDPQLVPNMFSSYDLTIEQAEEGSKLTMLQTMVIQNTLSNIALEKSALEIDPHNPHGSMQQEASLAGQIKILTHLLDSSIYATQQTEVLINDEQH